VCLTQRSSWLTRIRRPVQGYIPPDCVADRLRVTVAKLCELQDFGWIRIVEAKGGLFIARN
jgi:hypothetical protein